MQTEKETPQFEPKQMGRESKGDSYHSATLLPMFPQGHASLHPFVAREPFENQETNQQVPAFIKKKKRAATEHVASISLTDLAKYFDLPITEASRNLNVGLTALKKKCREFGIPRWPHRKIKSLDTLIYDLQILREEAARQAREEDKAAAMAVAKRQMMLEREKEVIEKKPFMELKSETKRFRQEVFKQKHKARALGKAATNGSNVDYCLEQ